MNDNCQVFLKARPAGLPRQDDFGIRSAPIPEPREGEFLVQIKYLSVDPYMRGHLQGGVYQSMKPVAIGDTLYGGAGQCPDHC